MTQQRMSQVWRMTDPGGGGMVVEVGLAVGGDDRLAGSGRSRRRALRPPVQIQQSVVAGGEDAALGVLAFVLRGGQRVATGRG